MLIDAKCCECGEDVQVENLDESSDFHGFIASMRIKSALCAPCSGKARSEEEKRREQDILENARRREEYEEHERTKVPRRIAEIVGRKYRNVGLSSFAPRGKSQESALSAAKNFSAEPRGFLYLHGKPGVGKTHLAIGIFRDHAKTIIEKRSSMDGYSIGFEQFKEVDFWTVPDLLLHLRSLIASNISEEEAIDPLIRSKLLILDDLGAEKITDWVRQAFYVVISCRERDELPTVITSNLSLGEIEARVGDDRITSRIGGSAKIVRIEGADGRFSRRWPYEAL